jgi:hypothetical protein
MFITILGPRLGYEQGSRGGILTRTVHEEEYASMLQPRED